MPSPSWRFRALALALFMVSCLTIQVSRAAAPEAEAPKTPAGKVFAAWLAAFNAGDPGQWRAFDAAYPREGTPPPIEDQLSFAR